MRGVDRLTKSVTQQQQQYTDGWYLGRYRRLRDSDERLPLSKTGRNASSSSLFLLFASSPHACRKPTAASPTRPLQLYYSTDQYVCRNRCSRTRLVHAEGGSALHVTLGGARPRQQGRRGSGLEEGDGRRRYRDPPLRFAFHGRVRGGRQEGQARVPPRVLQQLP